MSQRATYTTTFGAMPSTSRILLLAGTSEATALTKVLEPLDHIALTVSFAGRTSRPQSVAGRQRIGGFGGVDGLAGYLLHNKVDVLVDATHPFAARMRWNAHLACERLGIARVRIERPPWIPIPGDRWRMVPTLADAPDALAGALRVFLTTGRQDLGPFVDMRDTWFLVRSIEPPDPMPLVHAEVLLDRGPFTLERERSLLERREIDVLVTKNSGGASTAPKLLAARELGVDVVMVERPPSPPGPQFSSVAATLTWLERVLASR